MNTSSDFNKRKTLNELLKIFKWILLGTGLLGLLIYKFEEPQRLLYLYTSWKDSDKSTSKENQGKTFPNETFIPVNLDPCMNISLEVNRTSKGKCLFYNMVPKCGSDGTRHLIAALKKELNYSSEAGNYGIPGRIRRRQHSFKNTKMLVADMEERCRKSVKNYVYYRHQYFEPFSLLGTDYITPDHFNLIRDPVDHSISWYYFRRFARHGQGAGGLIPVDKSKVIQKNMTFNECVLTNHVECASSLFTYNIVPYFCGNDDLCLEPSMSSLNCAKRNVMKYFKVVGYLENYIQFLELCEYFWPQFFKGVVTLYLEKNKQKRKPVNMNPERHKLEPSEKVKAIMKTRMPVDYKFYHWIKQRFHCMYKSYIALNQRFE